MYIKSIITHLRTVCGLACCVFPCLNLEAQEVVAYNDLTDLNLNITVNYGDQSLISNLIDNSLTTVYTLDKFDGAWFIDFYSPVPLVVTGVNLVNGNTGRENDPKSWNLKCSEDGQNWGRAIQGVNAETFADAYTAKYFSVGRELARQWWRISITEVNGGESLALSELQLLGYQVSNDQLVDLSEATISSSYSPSEGKLENLVSDDMNQGVVFRSVNGGYIQYELPSAIQLKSYRICTGTNGNAPRSWVLKASNDGEQWDVLDRQTNRNFFNISHSSMEFSLTDLNRKVLDWYDLAKLSHEALNTRYWDNTKQYYLQKNSIPPHTGFNYWWMAHALDVLVDGYQRRVEVGGSRGELQAYQLKMNQLYMGVPRNNTSKKDAWWNSFYDDMEWMAIAALRAYQTTKEQKWMDVATELYDYIKGGWTDVHGGGVMWEKNSPNSKNACSNGPAMILAARLYRETGKQEYLDFATKIYDWMSVSLVNEYGGVWDGYGNYNEGMLLTYNQGTWLGGCLELYNITQDKKYYYSALTTAKYVVNDRKRFSAFGVLKGENSGDGGLFKGIFMRYLAQMITDNVLDEETEEEFTSFFLENGLSCYHAAMLKGDNLTFGHNWAEFPENTITDSSIHLSGIMLYEMINNLERSGKLAKLFDKYVANRMKSYKYFRLEELGRRDNYNLELSKFQLLSDTSVGLENVLSDLKPYSVTIEDKRLKVVVKNGSGGSICIYDSVGRSVWKDQYFNGVYEKQLSLSGLHVIHIQTDNDFYSAKLLF